MWESNKCYLLIDISTVNFKDLSNSEIISLFVGTSGSVGAGVDVDVSDLTFSHLTLLVLT